MKTQGISGTVKWNFDKGILTLKPVRGRKEGTFADQPSREWKHLLDYIEEIHAEGLLHLPKDASYMFHFFHGDSLDLSHFDSSQVENMTGMFDYCSQLRSLDISNLKTSNVKTMNSLFCCCHNLISLDLSTLDTHNVVDMSCMFSGCDSLTSINLSNFKTENVVSMFSMFYCCWKLQEIHGLENFDTANVETMYQMFSQCPVTKLDLSSFKADKVNNMIDMFRFCLELETLNLSNFTFNKDADLEHMLLGCKSLTTVFVNETNKNQVMQLVDDCNKIDFVVK